MLSLGLIRLLFGRLILVSKEIQIWVTMEPKSGEGITSIPQLPGGLNPNTRITPSLFRRNHKEWSHSTRMAIGGAKRLGYIGGNV